MKKAISLALLLVALMTFALPVAAQEPAPVSAWDYVVDFVGELMEGLFGNDAPEQSDSAEEQGEDGGGVPDIGTSPDPVG